MKFILWTLVWLGLTEVQTWRISKYRGVDYFDKHPMVVLATFAVETFLWIYLYIKFVN